MQGQNRGDRSDSTARDGTAWEVLRGERAMQGWLVCRACTHLRKAPQLLGRSDVCSTTSQRENNA